MMILSDVFSFKVSPYIYIYCTLNTANLFYNFHFILFLSIINIGKKEVIKIL